MKILVIHVDNNNLNVLMSTVSINKGLTYIVLKILVLH